MNEKVEEKQNEKLTINGVSIWRIITYFIIYSVIGFVIETIYGVITKGQLESRQSFLYGPFCGIYGLGATILIISLQNYKQNNHKLFFIGFLVGSIVEYLISLIGEFIFDIKWWDYSDRAFNIQGRICITFSMFWGLLSIYLMIYLNPKIDKFINFIKSKVSLRKLKVVVIIVTIFLILDMILTGYALQMFRVRIVHENNINVENKEKIDQKYEKIYVNNPKQAEIIYKYFGDKKMIRTFPNIKIKDVEGNILYYDSYVGDIQPYYYKFDTTIK